MLVVTLILSASCSSGVTMVVSDWCERYEVVEFPVSIKRFLVLANPPGLNALARNQKDFRCNCTDDKEDCG